MRCYPVIIVTLNRYDHLKRMIDSLQRNRLSQETELIIGLDYPPNEKYRKGYEKIKDYLPTITGFKKVSIFNTETNLGPMNNGRRLVEYVREKGYDGYISMEDDNEFSPCFLDFMNQAMKKYKNDNRIINISGHCGREFNSVSGNNIFCCVDVSAYGFGVWFEKDDLVIRDLNFIFSYFKKSLLRDLKIFSIYPAITYQACKMLESGSYYGDVCRVLTNIINNSFIICPSISMSRNWGADGSGLHSGVVKGLEKQYISEEKNFVLDDIEIKGTKEMYRRLFYRNMPQNKIKFVLYFVYKFLYLLKFYYFGKLGTNGTCK